MIDTFTIPPAALTDFNTFFQAVVEQESLDVAARWQQSRRMLDSSGLIS